MEKIIRNYLTKLETFQLRILEAAFVPNLNQLKTLSISSHADTFQSQLQTLLDRAPHLTKLMIRKKKSLPFQRSLFKYTNKFIRQVDLRSCNHYFNEEECLLLSSHSSLGVQSTIIKCLLE